MIETQMFLVAALAEAERLDAEFQDSYPDHPLDAEHDLGFDMLGEVCERFDGADITDEKVQQGMVVAINWLHKLGAEHACCSAHGEHLMATCRLLGATLARAQQSAKD